MRGRAKKVARGVQVDNNLYKRNAEEIGISAKSFTDEANKPPPIFPPISVTQADAINDSDRKDCAMAADISQRLTSSIWFLEKQATAQDIRRYSDKYSNAPDEILSQRALQSKIMELDPGNAYFPAELTNLESSHVSRILTAAAAKQSRLVVRKKGVDDDDSSKNDNAQSVEDSDSMTNFSEQVDDDYGNVDEGGDYDDF